MYCSSLLMCLNLERYFSSKKVKLEWFPLYPSFIRSLFGIHTLQECNAAVKRINGHTGSTPCVVLLGPLPSCIHLPLETVQEVFVFHSEMNLDSDVKELESTFHIPRSARIYRLITACSLEMNLLLPDKHVAKEFQYLLNRGTNKFVSTLKSICSFFNLTPRNSFLSYSLPSYSAFFSSQFNFVQSGSIFPLCLDRKTHVFTETSMEMIVWLGEPADFF